MLRSLVHVYFALIVALCHAGLADATPIFSDDFNDNLVAASWLPHLLGSGPTVTEQNQRLEIFLPSTSSDQPGAGIFWGALTVGVVVAGDFDARVDYSLLNWPAANGVRVGLGVEPLLAGGSPVDYVERVSHGVNDFPFDPTDVYVADYSGTIPPSAGTSALSGSLRLVRTGTAIEGFYLSRGIWISLGSSVANTTGASSFRLQVWSGNSNFTNQDTLVAFDNFSVTLVPEASRLLLFACALMLTILATARRDLLVQLPATGASRRSHRRNHFDHASVSTQKESKR